MSLFPTRNPGGANTSNKGGWRVEGRPAPLSCANRSEGSKALFANTALQDSTVLGCLKQQGRWTPVEARAPAFYKYTPIKPWSKDPGRHEGTRQSGSDWQRRVCGEQWEEAEKASCLLGLGRKDEGWRGKKNDFRGAAGCGRETSPYATTPPIGRCAGAGAKTSVNPDLQMTTLQLPTSAPEEVRLDGRPKQDPTPELYSHLKLLWWPKQSLRPGVEMGNDKLFVLGMYLIY